MMDRTLKALSLTLSYPSVDLQDAMLEIGAVLGADPPHRAGHAKGPSKAGG